MEKDPQQTIVVKNYRLLPASFRQPNPDHSFSHSSQSNSLSSSVSNQIKIDRFAMAPHYQSSGAPNTMTLNRDKNEHTK